jgi:urease accessory protein
MFDTEATLAILQWGDSALPAGGFAFSWGVEGLYLDGLVNDGRTLDGLVKEHLVRRWATMDRPLLGEAFRASSCDEIAKVDQAVDRATFAAPMREGSRRAGRALLNLSARLGGKLSIDYRALVSTNDTLGHLTAVQAIAYREAGISLEAAELLSGWTLVNGLVSAATRLGVIAHVEAQRCLSTARKMLARILAEPSPSDALPSSFTPLIDIAVSRMRIRPSRMFTT